VFDFASGTGFYHRPPPIDIPSSEHLNGFSPVCNRWCVFSWPLWTNDFEQFG